MFYVPNSSTAHVWSVQEFALWYFTSWHFWVKVSLIRALLKIFRKSGNVGSIALDGKWIGSDNAWKVPCKTDSNTLCLRVCVRLVGSGFVGCMLLLCSPTSIAMPVIYCAAIWPQDILIYFTSSMFKLPFVSNASLLEKLVSKLAGWWRVQFDGPQFDVLLAAASIAIWLSVLS